MICPKCNEEVGQDSKFCQHCGAKLLKPQTEQDTEEKTIIKSSSCYYEPVLLLKNILNEKEGIIFEERSHKKLSFFAALLSGGIFILIALISFLVAIVAPGALVVALITLIVGVIILLLAYLCWHNTIYVLTSDRVIVYRSVIGKSLYESRLNRIQDLRVRVGIIQRMANCGTIWITTAGTAGVESMGRNIANPMEKLKIMRDTIGF